MKEAKHSNFCHHYTGSVLKLLTLSLLNMTRILDPRTEVRCDEIESSFVLTPSHFLSAVMSFHLVQMSSDVPAPLFTSLSDADTFYVEIGQCLVNTDTFP